VAQESAWNVSATKANEKALPISASITDPIHMRVTESNLECLGQLNWEDGLSSRRDPNERSDAEMESEHISSYVTCSESFGGVVLCEYARLSICLLSAKLTLTTSTEICNAISI
jgi:hypothetical protein